MNLRFADLTKEGFKGITVAESLQHVTFRNLKPVMVQPSEIQRVQIGVACEIPAGYVLQISTYPKLAEQAAELFPALTQVDHTHEGELLLAVRNHGRNPLNLMPGTPIARGHLVKVEPLELEEFDFEVRKAEVPKSKPQKKNPFSFEVR